ncbi:Os01g0907000 [Oryza sativa Japonica Group]|uniref:Os01g0907000 protein n=1 Tax=Oryza sativa subsp. japonica TaxID=39947 RepID=A0A0P0VC06_ORYSJ|nr:Os01g0907000 [Oryza sativa Japonica Group]
MPSSPAAVGSADSAAVSPHSTPIAAVQGPASPQPDLARGGRIPPCGGRIRGRPRWGAPPLPVPPSTPSPSSPCIHRSASSSCSAGLLPPPPGAQQAPSPPLTPTPAAHPSDPAGPVGSERGG